jgi:hypothetical protein
MMKKKWRLVYESDGHPARVGDKVVTFRGNEGRLMGFREPQHVASSGRVYVSLERKAFCGESMYQSEFFPGVIGARFVEVDAPDED